MLFCLGMVFTFGVGGLTGLYLADILADIYLHDTFFVVGHFHLIMAAAVLLALFAAIYFWFPKMFGRMMNERLGKLHFWLTFVSAQPGVHAASWCSATRACSGGSTIRRSTLSCSRSCRSTGRSRTRRS